MRSRSAGVQARRERNIAYKRGQALFNKFHAKNAPSVVQAANRQIARSDYRALRRELKKMRDSVTQTKES